MPSPNIIDALLSHATETIRLITGLQYLQRVSTRLALNHQSLMPKFAFIILIVHYNDVIMGAVASQITSLTIVYSTVDSDADQRKHQSSTSLAFVRGIHQGAVNSPHKWPVTRKMFPFDDIIMYNHEHTEVCFNTTTIFPCTRVPIMRIRWAQEDCLIY